MARRPLTRGFTLVELTVGMAIGGFIAAMALTSLAAGGALFRRLAMSARCEDHAWFALSAMARDFEASGSWHSCTEARDCPGADISARYRVPVFIAGNVGWLLQDGLRRCGTGCDTVASDIVALEVLADISYLATNGGPTDLTRRRPFLQRHGSDVRSLEFTVTVADGRRFTRVVSRPDVP
jgi:prepilin-type N-terminal cleavage/methylation domain-containing protein